MSDPKEQPREKSRLGFFGGYLVGLITTGITTAALYFLPQDTSKPSSAEPRQEAGIVQTQPQPTPSDEIRQEPAAVIIQPTKTSETDLEGLTKHYDSLLKYTEEVIRQRGEADAGPAETIRRITGAPEGTSPAELVKYVEDFRKRIEETTKRLQERGITHTRESPKPAAETKPTNQNGTSYEPHATPKSRLEELVPYLNSDHAALIELNRVRTDHEEKDLIITVGIYKGLTREERTFCGHEARDLATLLSNSTDPRYDTARSNIRRVHADITSSRRYIRQKR